MATIRIRQPGTEKDGVSQSTLSLDQIPPLGAEKLEKRFWWQRTRAIDPYAIATQVRLRIKHYPIRQFLIPLQPSVFDDPDTAEKYQPPDNW